MSSRVPVPVVALAAGLSLALLAGCQSAGVQQETAPGTTEQTTSAAPAEAPPTDAGAATTEAVVTRRVAFGTGEIEASIGPVVLDGDDAFLRIVTRQVAGDDRIREMPYPNSTSSRLLGPGGAVRILDLPGGRVHEASAWTRSNRVLPAEETDEQTIERATWYSRMESDGLSAGTLVAVMLTSVGVIDGVPVVDADDPNAYDTADLDVRPPAEGYEQAVTADLEVYTRALDESADTRITEDQVEINLASDVLFAVDSADLDPAALRVLADTTTRREQTGGGDLQIVGHTDDTATAAYNQDLSERRAGAVHHALGSLTDLGDYQVEVSGRGQNDPRIDGTTEEARAANRRVEIVITADGPTGTLAAQGEVADAAEQPALPEPPEITAAGPEGAVVEHGDAVARVTLDHVTRLDGYLVGEVRVEAVEGRVSTFDLFSYGSRTVSGEASGGQTPDGLMLLHDGQMIAPIQYHLEGTTSRYALTDKMPVRTEGVQIVTVVWPDTGQETVTASYEFSRNAPAVPYRLTDIPVQDAGADG